MLRIATRQQWSITVCVRAGVLRVVWLRTCMSYGAAACAPSQILTACWISSCQPNMFFFCQSSSICTVLELFLYSLIAILLCIQSCDHVRDCIQWHVAILFLPHVAVHVRVTTLHAYGVRREGVLPGWVTHCTEPLVKILNTRAQVSTVINGDWLDRESRHSAWKWVSRSHVPLFWSTCTLSSKSISDEIRKWVASAAHS